MTAARSCGSRVEVMSARTDSVQVFADPGGTTTIEQSLVPEMVRTAGGGWTAVDPTLVSSNGAWKPRASPVDVTLSNGGSGPFATYRLNGSTVTLSWPLGTLPGPAVSGSTAEYRGVLPGVDLWVVVSSTGFRPVLEVENAAAAANPALRAITYTVGGGVSAATMPDGRVRFGNATNPAVVVADQAVAWDSSTQVVGGAEPDLVSTASEPGDLAHVSAATVSTSGGNLTVAPDPSLLTGASTVFPVYVDPSISPSENRFAYADNANANNDTTRARVGYDPESGDIYRSYFNFPTSQSGLTWVGKQIVSAEFDAELYHSWACSDSQDDWAWAYHASGISQSPRMPWSGGGSSWLPSNSNAASAQGHADKDSGCGGVAQPDMLMRFSGGSGSGLKGEVQTAANQRAATFTVGLCACNPSSQYENVQARWKKFYVDSRVKLIVKYDTAPGTPVNLTTSDTACGSGIGTTSPTFRGQAPDADNGDYLQPTFQYQQVPGGGVTTVTPSTTYPSNNYPTYTAALGAAADGHTYQWRMQAKDTNGTFSPWSAWCQFAVVTSAPPLPTVTPTAGASGTPVYAPCNVQTCDAYGGPGVAGSFTLAGGASNVISYTYGWTTPPTMKISVPAGASTTITVSPPRYGLNTLYVSSYNGVKTSPILAYQFVVGAPSAALAWWPLDDIDGRNLTDQVSGVPLATSGGVSWQPDARYIGQKAANFDGTGAATGPVPALNTSGSFSVAAWVRPTALSDHNMTAVGQDGVDAGGFYLGLRYLTTSAGPYYWSFFLTNTSSTTGAAVAANSPTPVSAADLNKWAFLVGVYDAAANTVSLYVNGQLVTSVTRPVPGWRAAGPVSIGRSSWTGLPSDWFTGQIADVRVWNRVVTSDDIWGTPADSPSGATVGLMAPTQVGSWNFEDDGDLIGCQCGGSAADGSPFARRLYLDPRSTNPQPSSQFVNDPAMGIALENDGLPGGVGGFASTTNPSTGSTRPVLRTDQSFTVSAWVRLSQLPSGWNGTIVGQDGTVDSAFSLQYDNAGGTGAHWAMLTTNTDTSEPGLVAALAPQAVTTDLTMVTGVYDAATGTAKVYVNGAFGASATGVTAWQAGGSLTVGRALWDGLYGTPFPGLIDDVQAWQGALSDQQIADLYQTGDQVG
jgi:hypothetical protein